LTGREITGRMGYSYVARNMIAYVNRKYFWSPSFSPRRARQFNIFS